MNTRREFLQRSAVVAAAAVAGSRADGATPVRRVNARHRNLFNGDTCVFFYNPEKWQPEGGPYSAQAIHRYVDLLADSGIDTFVVNANASRAWYPSKVIPTILDGYRRGDREYFRGHAICAGATEPAAVEKYIDGAVIFFNRYLDLVEAGVDWLAEAAKGCRRRNISPWVSVRMNDMHGHLNYAGSFFNLPLLGRPEMRLQRSAYSPTQWIPDYRGGLNYEKAEVRALMFAQIKEVVEDYDYDGLELDWLRNPLCCEPNTAPQNVEMMSDWFRSVRVLTRRRAEQTGRPYPFGFRCPGRLETLKSIGIDVVTLCREGTLDWIAPSNFWRTSWDMPLDEIRRQVGDGVTIYGGIEAGANRLATTAPKVALTREFRPLPSSRALMRGNAAGKVALGADGVEWYNFFVTDDFRVASLTSDYGGIRDVYRAEALRGQPKHYVFSDQGGRFVHIPFETIPQVPVTLERGWHHAFKLPMLAEPADRGLELIVQVVLRQGDTFAWLPVTFNGCWPNKEHVRTDKVLFPCGDFTHHSAEHYGCDFRFPLALVRDGWNEIVVENGGERTITIEGVEVGIRAKA